MYSCCAFSHLSHQFIIIIIVVVVLVVVVVVVVVVVSDKEIFRCLAKKIFNGAM